MCPVGLCSEKGDVVLFPLSGRVSMSPSGSPRTMLTIPRMRASTVNVLVWHSAHKLLKYLLNHANIYIYREVNTTLKGNRLYGPMRDFVCELYIYVDEYVPKSLKI